MFRRFLETELGKDTLRLVLATVATVAIYCGLYFGLWSDSVAGVSNASFVCFAAAFLVGFLSLGNKYCFFTSLQYGFSYMFGSLGRYYRFRNGGTYGDFVEQKRQKKVDVSYPYLPYFIVCLVWLIVAFSCYPWGITDNAVTDLPSLETAIWGLII